MEEEAPHSSEGVEGEWTTLLDSIIQNAHIFLNWHVIYNSATQAVEDLWKQGFTVGEVPPYTRVKGISTETLAQLLPWKVTETRCGGENQFQWQMREKLKECRRTESGMAAGDE